MGDVDTHLVCARYLAIDTVHEAHFLDAAHEFLRRAFVRAGDEFGEGDVTRHRERRTDGQDGVHLMGVGVLDREIAPGFACDGDRIVDVDLAVIQGGYEGDCLKG